MRTTPGQGSWRANSVVMAPPKLPTCGQLQQSRAFAESLPAPRARGCRCPWPLPGFTAPGVEVLAPRVAEWAQRDRPAEGIVHN